MTATLAIVSDVAPDTIVSSDPAPEADHLTPDAILRQLASRLAGDPFATDRKSAAIRSIGTALKTAIERHDAARDQARRCEDAAIEIATRALDLLTGA